MLVQTRTTSGLSSSSSISSCSAFWSGSERFESAVSSLGMYASSTLWSVCLDNLEASVANRFGGVLTWLVFDEQERLVILQGHTKTSGEPDSLASAAISVTSSAPASTAASHTASNGAPSAGVSRICPDREKRYATGARRALGGCCVKEPW